MQILKSSVSGRRKRGILAALLAVSYAMGKGDGILTADCVFCGRETRRDVPLTSDDRMELCHVIPEAFGGSYIPSNLVIGCFGCNRKMHTDYATEYVWAYDPRPMYPATCPNVPAGAPDVTRPMSTRGHGLIRK